MKSYLKKKNQGFARGGNCVKGIELFARTTAEGWDCWGDEVIGMKEETAIKRRRKRKVTNGTGKEL